MGVADNSASKQPGKGIRKGVATGVDIVSRSELGQGLPCEVDRAKALPNHGQAWVRGFLDPLPLVQMHHLRWVKEFDPKAVEGARGQGERGGVMVAGVDEAVEGGVFVLDGFDGAPEDPLAAAAVVGVGVEEGHRSFSVVYGGEYLERESEDQG